LYCYLPNVHTIKGKIKNKAFPVTGRGGV
jgi:hypothetical protein